MQIFFFWIAAMSTFNYRCKEEINKRKWETTTKKLYVNVEYCAKVLHTIFVRQNTKLVFILIKKKEGLQNESMSGKDIISTSLALILHNTV